MCYPGDILSSFELGKYSIEVTVVITTKYKT